MMKTPMVTNAAEERESGSAKATKLRASGGGAVGGGAAARVAATVKVKTVPTVTKATVRIMPMKLESPLKAMPMTRNTQNRRPSPSALAERSPTLISLKRRLQLRLQASMR